MVFFFIEKMTTFYKALSFNKFFLFSKIIGSCEREVIELLNLGNENRIG